MGDTHMITDGCTGAAFYPAFCLKNAELHINFGNSPLKHPAPAGYATVAKAQHEHRSAPNC